MRRQLICEFKETEEQAIAFCNGINSRETSYIRKNKPAHYTPWESSSPNDTMHFVCWYWR